MECAVIKKSIMDMPPRYPLKSSFLRYLDYTTGISSPPCIIKSFENITECTADFHIYLHQILLLNYIQIRADMLQKV